MFVDIVLEMCLRERTEPEFKKLKKLNPKQRVIYEKTMKHRALRAEKNRVYFADILNVIKHGGNSFMTREELLNMTYHEAMLYYEAQMSKIQYYEYLQYKTSANYKVEEDIKHWTHSIKLK
jgi:hypothetical protein